MLFPLWLLAISIGNIIIFYLDNIVFCAVNAIKVLFVHLFFHYLIDPIHTIHKIPHSTHILLINFSNLCFPLLIKLRVRQGIDSIEPQRLFVGILPEVVVLQVQSRVGKGWDQAQDVEGFEVGFGC
jgi:hypothetical protein